MYICLKNRLIKPLFSNFMKSFRLQIFQLRLTFLFKTLILLMYQQTGAGEYYRLRRIH